MLLLPVVAVAEDLVDVDVVDAEGAADAVVPDVDADVERKERRNGCP